MTDAWTRYDRQVRRRVQISQTTVNTMMDMMPRRAVALHRLFLIDDMVSPSVTSRLPGL